MIVPPHRLDDDELLALSEANAGWHIEREPDGSLFVRPNSFRDSIRALEAARQLIVWDAEGRGHVAGADGGVTLPNGAVRAPDAAWIRKDRWSDAAIKDRTKDAHVVPDVVVEIVSPSDRWTQQLAKTEAWHEQGAAYAIVIDPATRRHAVFGVPPRRPRARRRSHHRRRRASGLG